MTLADRAVAARLEPSIRWFPISACPNQPVSDLIREELRFSRRPKHLTDEAAELYEASRIFRARRVIERSLTWASFSAAEVERRTLLLAATIRRLVARIRVALLCRQRASGALPAGESVLLVESLVDAACAPPVAVPDRNPEGLAA